MKDRQAIEILKSWLEAEYQNWDKNDDSSAELYEAIQVIFALINRQMDKIEQFDEDRNMYQNLYCLTVKDLDDARSKAVKEFAYRLKCGVPQDTGVIRCIDVDNVVKEMIGECNA